MWAVTNNEQVGAVRRQLRLVASRHVLVEPFGRNTAAAIGLAAVHVLKENGGNALMAVPPADHFIRKPPGFPRVLCAAFRGAARRRALVRCGIQPSLSATGYCVIDKH